MPHAPMLLAIEGGGTHTRMQLVTEQGELLCERELGPASPLYADPLRYGPVLLAMLQEIRASAEGPVALTALAGPVDRALMPQWVAQIFPETRLVTASEGAVAMAASGIQVGVVIVAGTGSSGWACNEQGEWRSCGGFGPQFDDAGSAYWIGRRGVAAVARAADGRGPVTSLTESVYDYFEVSQPFEILQERVGNGHLAVQRVAGVAPLVTAAAREGDGAANAIVVEAARAWAELAVTVHREAGIARQPTPVTPAGGVFRGGDAVLKALRAALHRADFDAAVLPPVVAPIRGLVKAIVQNYQQLQSRQRGS